MRRRFLALALFATSALFAAESNPTAENYELRGFFGKDGKTEISLRHVGTQKAGWYRLGEKADGILVEKADANTGTAVIVVNGTRRTLRIAGEVRSEPEADIRAKRADYTKELMGFIDKWPAANRLAMMHSSRNAAIELFKNHPEYFDKRASDTPEAKTALMNIVKKSILDGAAGTDAGASAPLPEKLDAMINTLYSNLTINREADPSDSNAGIRATTTINGAPHSFIFHGSGAENWAAYAGEKLMSFTREADEAPPAGSGK